MPILMSFKSAMTPLLAERPVDCRQPANIPFMKIIRWLFPLLGERERVRASFFLGEERASDSMRLMKKLYKSFNDVLNLRDPLPRFLRLQIQRR